MEDSYSVHIVNVLKSISVLQSWSDMMEVVTLYPYFGKFDRQNLIITVVYFWSTCLNILKRARIYVISI